MFPWYFSTAGPGHGTPIRQGVTVDKQKLLLFLFACLSVFWADIPLIENNPCFEGNFIAKLVLKTNRPTNQPTDRPTCLGLNASSRGIKIKSRNSKKSRTARQYWSFKLRLAERKTFY
jgi:hypothetical protein